MPGRPLPFRRFLLFTGVVGIVLNVLLIWNMWRDGEVRQLKFAVCNLILMAAFFVSSLRTKELPRDDFAESLTDTERQHYEGLRSRFGWQWLGYWVVLLISAQVIEEFCGEGWFHILFCAGALLSFPVGYLASKPARDFERAIKQARTPLGDAS